MKITIPALVCVFVLAGCGGGGGGDSPPPAQTPPPPPPSESPAGIWNGTVSENGAIINEISCLITIDDQIGCILIDPANGQLAGGAIGNVSVSGDDISGSGTAYAAFGYVLANNSTVGGFTINSGTVSERNSLSMTATLADAVYAISASFDSASYDRDSSLSIIAGSYTSFFVQGEPASFSIDANGELFAQSSSGCVANGQVDVISPTVNGYTVALTISNCPGVDGDYSGLATAADAVAPNDTFLFGVFNASGGLIGTPVK